MEENNSYITHICPNCACTLQSTDKYCYQCGQKQSTKKRSLSQLFQEFIDNVLNIDARIWKTFLAIFIPGKLTKQYFLGRHKSYSNPIRFFLVTSIILFSIASFKGVDFLKLEIVDSDIWKKTERSLYFKEFHGLLDSVTTVLKTENDSPLTHLALDSLKARMPYPEKLDSIEANINVNFAGMKLNPTDIIELEEEELLKRYQPESYGQRLFIKQFVRVIKKSGNFANFIWSNFPLMLLFMMPALAFLMKVLYIRKGHYFVEHLVFSFHVHAFLFLLLGFVQLFNFEGLPDWVKKLFVFLFAVYLCASLYRYYGQGVAKTFVKFIILSFGYMLLLFFSCLITFFISAMVF